jgi:hypothetical protein
VLRGDDDAVAALAEEALDAVFPGQDLTRRDGRLGHGGQNTTPVALFSHGEETSSARAALRAEEMRANKRRAELALAVGRCLVVAAQLAFSSEQPPGARVA